MKKYYYIIFGSVFIWIVVFIGKFIFTFYDHDYSSNIEDWGTFGDYFGGVINPFIAFLNVVIFIVIAKLAHDINNNIADSQIKQNVYQAYYNLINEYLIKILESGNLYLESRNVSANIPSDIQVEKARFESRLDSLITVLKGILNETDIFYDKESLVYTDYENSVKNLTDFLKDLKSSYKQKSSNDLYTELDKLIEFKSKLIRSINNNILSSKKAKKQ